MGFLGDKFLKDFRFGVLRITEIHHLIEEFMDDDEIIANAFLFQFGEILIENLNDFVHVDDHHGGVGVGPRNHHQIDVVVFHKGIGEAVMFKDGANTRFIFLIVATAVVEDQTHKMIEHRMSHVAPIIAINKDLALGVENVQCTR